MRSLTRPARAAGHGGQRAGPVLDAIWWLPCLALLFVAALALPSFQVAILNQFLAVGIAALGFNLMFGNAGQISLGGSAFLGTGAFTAAGLTLGLGVPFPLAVLGAGLAAALVGIAIGIPSLRLSSHYLIFSTLALHFIAVFVFGKIQQSSPGFSVPQLIPIDLHLGRDERLSSWSILYAVLFVATVQLVRNLLQRRPGRAWTAIREHPAAAAMMGVDVVFWRLTAFALSAFFFGLVGALQLFYLRHASVDDFNLGVVISYVAVILVGGLGSVFGSIVGAATIVAVPYLISGALESGILGDTGMSLQRHQFALAGLIYGALIVLVLVIEPGGIAVALRRLRTAAVRKPARASAQRTAPRLPARAGSHPSRQTSSLQVPSKVLLRVRDLAVAYGGAAEAVRDLTLDLREGDIVTILGPNGAGKTTALRAIAGFLPGEGARVSAAALTFRDHDLRGLDPAAVARLGVSFVPERDKVFRGLSIGEHLRLRSPADPASRSRVRSAIHLTFPQLAALDQRTRAGMLSGGERQMLALSLALAGQPSLLLVDEATLGLAPVAITQLTDALRKLNRELGVTILIAEQNIRVALDLSDQIYALNGGQIVDAGPASTWTEGRIRHAYLGGQA